MMKTETQKKMGTSPISTLMLSMAIPIVLSMVLQAVYNIVDSIFVANMAENGEQALNALTIAFPLQMLMVAIGIGTGVGTNALLSKSLGQGNKEKASRTMGNSLFMGAIIYIFFLLFGIFGIKAYILSQTANSLIYDMALNYLQICCIMSFGIVFFSIYEKILQAEGNSLYSTIAQVGGAVTNIILDPVMIYGLIGFPKLGVTGAALATVIGQIFSFILALIFHFKADKDISNKIKYFKPSLTIIKEIYAIGLPAIIAQALMSFMTYGLNIILVRISESMVTAYGLYYKIQQFILFAAFGLRDAITPIISFNHGMESRHRIKDGIKYGMIYTSIIMIAGMFIIEIFADSFSELFGLSGETRMLCASAMKIISLSFVFAGANIAFQGIFQALDGGIESLVISVCRQFAFIFPFVILFAHIAEKYAELSWTVWTAFPICEIFSVIIAVILYKKVYKNKVVCIH